MHVPQAVQQERTSHVHTEHFIDVHVPHEQEEIVHVPVFQTHERIIQNPVEITVKVPMPQVVPADGLPLTQQQPIVNYTAEAVQALIAAAMAKYPTPSQGVDSLVTTGGAEGTNAAVAFNGDEKTRRCKVCRMKCLSLSWNTNTSHQPSYRRWCVGDCRAYFSGAKAWHCASCGFQYCKYSVDCGTA